MNSRMGAALAVGVFFWGTCAFAGGDPSAVVAARAAFCRDAGVAGFAQRRLMDADYRPYEVNAGGFANGGVCWWHARLARAAAELAYYVPELDRPSEAQAWDLLVRLHESREVVQIPGYANLRDFTGAYPEMVQKFLNHWQAEDGGLHSHWVLGISGGASIQPKYLRDMMNKLYDQVALRRRVAFEMLQLPGIVTHALLIIGMERQPQGYVLTVVDSNFQDIRQVVYNDGDSTVYDDGYYGPAGYVPYTSYTEELTRQERILKGFCSAH